MIMIMIIMIMIIITMNIMMMRIMLSFMLIISTKVWSSWWPERGVSYGSLGKGPADHIAWSCKYFHQPENSHDDDENGYHDNDDEERFDNDAVEGVGRLQGGSVGPKHLYQTRQQLEMTKWIQKPKDKYLFET